MSISPIITFKAGKCEADLSRDPPRVTPIATPGFLYLYNEEDLVHLCWRPRDASLDRPELDLVMVPPDASFKPYLGKDNIPSKSPVNGRVFVLKFSTSAERRFFWLQSRERPPGEPSHFSPRDLRLGEIVHNLLQGIEVDAGAEIASLRNQTTEDDDDEDDDAEMEDAQESTLHRSASGGAGADATGGDIRDEGEESREGGADGGRASQNQMNAAIQNFINSLQGNQPTNSPQQSQRDFIFTTLNDLLPSSTTTASIDLVQTSVTEDLLAQNLPPPLTFLEHQVDDPPEEADEDTIRTSVEALSEFQQKDILRRVLQSPQFTQSLMGLTTALREGALPTLAEALKVDVVNGGYTGPDRRTPLGGGQAVQAFLDGILKAVQKE